MHIFFKNSKIKLIFKNNYSNLNYNSKNIFKLVDNHFYKIFEYLNKTFSPN